MSRLTVEIDGRSFEVELRVPSGSDGNNLPVRVDGEELNVSLSSLDGPEQIVWAVVDNRPREITLDPDLHWVRSYSGMHTVEVTDREAVVRRPMSGDGRVKAPIPGLVSRVLVQPGDQVEAGQPILTIEAMKMENEIRAPRTGAVSQVHVTPGQPVALNMVIAEIG